VLLSSADQINDIKVSTVFSLTRHFSSSSRDFRVLSAQ
jgi:hypothetical protein